MFTDTDFLQQRFKTYPANVSSFYIAVTVIVIAILFIPSGVKLTNSANKVFQRSTSRLPQIA
jgi:hypothetical protein